MKLSVIVPALNEEVLLPTLLKSLQSQTFTDFEIIISDGNSTDKTVEIARNAGCKVAQESKSPGDGRNKGAKLANGELLLFLDADVVLEDANFLLKILNEFEARRFDVATCYMKPLSSKKIDVIMHDIANLYVKTTQNIFPHAPGFFILVKKSIHEKLNGFAKLELAEDHDYVARAAKFGKFGILESGHIFVSVRRLEKEGRLKLAAKYAIVEVYRMFNGKVEKPMFSYEFGRFDKKNKKS